MNDRHLPSTMTTVFSRVVADVSMQFIENFPPHFDFLGLLQRICEDTGVNITASEKNYSLQGPWSPMERARGMLASTLAVYSAAESVNAARLEQEAAAAAGIAGSRPFSALVEAAEAVSRGEELSVQARHDLQKLDALSEQCPLPHPLPPISQLPHHQLLSLPIQSSVAMETMQLPVLPSVEPPMSTMTTSMTGVSSVAMNHSEIPEKVYTPLPPFETIHTSRKAKAEQNLQAAANHVIDTKIIVKQTLNSPAKKVKPRSPLKTKQRSEPLGEKDEDYYPDSDKDWCVEDSVSESEEEKKVGLVMEEPSPDQSPEPVSEAVVEPMSKRTTRSALAKAAESSIPVKKRGRARKTVDNSATTAAALHRKVKKKYTGISQQAKNGKPEKVEEQPEKPPSPEELDEPSTQLDDSKSEEDSESLEKRTRGRPKKSPKNAKTEFPCDLCGLICRTRNGLGDHKHRIHFAKPTKCDICEKVFSNSRYMRRHRASHVKPQHCCDICGKMYKVAKALRDHRKRHDLGYKPPEFQCTMCPKSFCTRYILELHVKSEHMGIKKKFLCSTCGKSFTTKHTLQQHANVHIGARPYPCDVCGKSFSYESALRDHKFIHSGLKRFVCRYCSKAFRQRSALKMHEKIHQEHKDFTCDECGRGFTQKQALQRHVRAHKGDKPFSCKLCGRTFGDASIIRRHMILVHKVHKDPNCWREDIVSNVKPNKDYYVKSPDDLMKPTDDMELKEESQHEYQPIEIPQQLMLSRPDIQETVPLDSYPAHVLSAAEAHQPAPNPVQSVEERLATAAAYVINTPTPSHHEYSQVPHSPSNHYSYPVSAAETQQYHTLPRSTELVRASAQEQDPRHSLDPSQVLDHTQSIQILDPRSLSVEHSRTLEAENPDRPVDATVHTQSVHSVVSSVARSADVMPSVSVSQSPDASQPQAKVEEIAKRLHDTEPPENLSISSLYAYYTSLASQYMNMAQYTNYVPHQDPNPENQ